MPDDAGAPEKGKSEQELAEQVRRLVEQKGGDAQAVSLMLLNDNQKARERARKAEERAEAAEKKIPKEGSVVITKEEAADFEAYKALGKPAEVKTTVEKAKTLETEKQEREKSEGFTKAAEAIGYNGKVLADLALKNDLIIETVDEQQNGKTVKVPYARKNEDKAVRLPLADFMKKEFADYLPALTAKGGGNNSGTAGTGATSTTQYPEQGPTGGTAPKGELADKFLADRNKRAAEKVNPLNPQKPAAASTT